MSDTQRTDAHNWHDGDYDDPLHAFYDFACQLERELNAANDHIKRLEEAGDEMEKYCSDYYSSNKWLKAKEDKLSVNPIQSLGANLMKAGIGFTTEDKP